MNRLLQVFRRYDLVQSFILAEHRLRVSSNRFRPPASEIDSIATWDRLDTVRKLYRRICRCLYIVIFADDTSDDFPETFSRVCRGKALCPIQWSSTSCLICRSSRRKGLTLLRIESPMWNICRWRCSWEDFGQPIPLEYHERIFSALSAFDR